MLHASPFQIHYKEEHKKSKDKCTFVPDTPLLNHVKQISAFISEVSFPKPAKWLAGFFFLFIEESLCITLVSNSDNITLYIKDLFI